LKGPRRGYKKKIKGGGGRKGTKRRLPSKGKGPNKPTVGKRGFLERNSTFQRRSPTKKDKKNQKVGGGDGKHSREEKGG